MRAERQRTQTIEKVVKAGERERAGERRIGEEPQPFLNRQLIHLISSHMTVPRAASSHAVEINIDSNLVESSLSSSAVR